MISDGCIINHSKVTNSIIGIRSTVNERCDLNRVILLGSDYYESENSIIQFESNGIPRIGVGKNTVIREAIVDKNARIGDNCVITPDGKPQEFDHPLYYIRDGVVIIPKNGIIPSGTVI
jgi:glucose-1-phosphate adenylyltransferase